MRIASIIENDVVNGEGVCVSLWVQGCPHSCPGCHNPETWDFDGGYEMDIQTLTAKLIYLIDKNGIQRNFSILGGEPLAPCHVQDIIKIICSIKELFPRIKIFLWTGYTIEELVEQHNPHINYILSNIDVLIEGRYIKEQRDLTLKLRGSRNQRILTKNEIYNIININNEGNKN